MQALGRFLFRWRSFTPVPLLALAAFLIWRNRGPASPLCLVGGLALCVAGQALRFAVLGQVPDGTSGQNEKLGAVSLNTRGPYAYTRNPLYLAGTTLVLGVGLVSGIVWFLLIAVLAAFAVQKLAIEREERHLQARFGRTYVDYAERVRRWI